MIIGKRIFILVTVCCFLAAFCVIALNGSKYTETFIVSDRNNAESSGSAEDYYVTVQDQGIVEITGVRLEGSRLKIDLRSLSRGTTFIEAGRRNVNTRCICKRFMFTGSE